MAVYVIYFTFEIIIYKDKFMLEKIQFTETQLNLLTKNKLKALIFIATFSAEDLTKVSFICM